MFFYILSKTPFQKGGADHTVFLVVFRTMANEQNLKEPFSPSVAREMQKKSAEKRKQNTAEKKLIRDRILERMGQTDWDEMIDGLIERSKESDKAFELLRDTIGQKPVEKVAVGATDEAKNELKELLEQRNACRG